MRADGSDRRWHYFLHLESDKNIILMAYRWWLDAPDAEKTLSDILERASGSP